MKVLTIYRYSREKDHKPKFVDDLPNFFYFTHTKNRARPLLEKGISPIGVTNASDGDRHPAILISSSPHRVGSSETPWEDIFDSDNGHIRYFGDNKNANDKPELKAGNKILLEQHQLHTSAEVDQRRRASPLIFFRRVPSSGRIKGNVQIHGFGIVSKVERITQFNRNDQETFTNYCFDFTVLSLNAEDERFAWEWISKRRDPGLSTEETLSFAPSSWKKWVRDGPSSVEKNRRRISNLYIISTDEQKPKPSSDEGKTLLKIYNFCNAPKRKKRFEVLASLVASKIIKNSSNQYYEKWITPAGSDHGIDFMGRLDIGNKFGKAKIIVLGQAKCEKLDQPTGGNHIARTVARLRRGWMGVYVTTSYFSEKVQREILEDKYPILLINGLQIAETVNTIVNEEGESLPEFLRKIDEQYEEKIASRNPEEVLYD